MPISLEFDYTHLKPNDLIRVTTVDDVYNLAILDAPRGCNVLVLVFSDKITTPTRVVLNGSSVGGLAVKAGKIIQGMPLSLAVLNEAGDLAVGYHTSPEVLSWEVEEDSEEAKRMIKEKYPVQ